MNIENCFYVKMKPSTKSERIYAMAGNMSMDVAVLEAPNGILKLKNVAAKASIQEKLEMSGLFERVAFMKNFKVE